MGHAERAFHEVRHPHRIAGRLTFALQMTLAAAMTTGCTHAAWNPNVGWRTLATDQVRFHTDTLVEHVATLRTVVLASRIYSTTLFREFPRPQPVEVLYLENIEFSPRLSFPGHGAANDRYLTLLGCPATDKKPAVGAFAAVGPSGGNVREDATEFMDPTSTNRYPSHQIAHLYVGAALPAAPLWFQEGLALYLTRFHTVRNGGRDFACFGALSAIRASIPTRDLFAATWGTYHETQGNWINETSEILVHFLIHGRGGELRTRFVGLMDAFARGLDTRAAVAAVYPELDLSKLDQMIQDHARTPRPRPWDTACALPFRLDFDPSQNPDPPVIDTPETTIKSLLEQLKFGRAEHRGWADFVPECD